MTLLLLGLILFLGAHSLRLVAPAWRERYLSKSGIGTYKAIYSFISLCGLILLVYGYGLARTSPVFLYETPLWARHLSLPLTWLAFVLLAATHGPANHFRAMLGHPMYAGVKVWAAAHLLANGMLADLLLFGTFLIWASAGFSIRRRQDKAAGVTQTPGTLRGTLGALVIGTVAWVIFALWLHRILIGVYPLPG